ncbi:MAG: cysteine--tRNA ligase, partial [Candidatus Sungbacteria bacterium RIFCSPLOWO2_02_FULL_47_9]
MFLRRPSEDFLLLLECFLWYKKRMIRIYNTLTNKKEDFEPANDKRVNFFVCGPTVYDSSHIGHARTYISFDVIVKYLRYAGYEVFYLQNITDVDDKIIARAHETEEDPLFLSRHFAKEYFEDMQELKITSPSKYASASEFIPQIIKQIETLVKKGVAYSTPSGVYYDITKFPEYGKLSHQNQSTLLKAVRIEEDPNKQNDFDFVLWKAKKPGEPFWQSPWGEGRPGWHIEDTAISEYFFGPQYDVHGGGIDLKFPHHESEIAQQEAASDKVPFVKYWLHTGHLQVEKQKMSKSLKNFITIRDILKKHSSEAFRLL